MVRNLENRICFESYFQVGQYIEEEEEGERVVGSKLEHVEPRITEEKKKIQIPSRKTSVQGVS